MPLADDKDACELLDADHIATKHLFVEYARLAYAAAMGGEDDQRTSLAMTICDELTIHATIEEEIFYPAFEQSVPGAAGLMEEARAEHQQAKSLIAQIQAMGSASPEMDELVAELNRAVEHHVKEERCEVFPKAQAAEGMDLFELGQRMLERQQELKGVTA